MMIKSIVKIAVLDKKMLIFPEVQRGETGWKLGENWVKAGWKLGENMTFLWFANKNITSALTKLAKM